MIPYQHSEKFLTQPVQKFLCSDLEEGATSDADPIACQARDLCHAAGIATLRDLKEKTVDDLRGASFTSETIDFIRGRLAEVRLFLLEDGGYRMSFAESVQPHVKPPAFLKNMTPKDKEGAELYLRHLGIAN